MGAALRIWTIIPACDPRLMCEVGGYYTSSPMGVVCLSAAVYLSSVYCLQICRHAFFPVASPVVPLLSCLEALFALLISCMSALLISICLLSATLDSDRPTNVHTVSSTGLRL